MDMSEIKPVSYELYIEAINCNPNGDPSNGGEPRMTDDGFGIISPVCIKHKMREAAKVIVSVKSDKYDPERFGIFMDASKSTTRLKTMEECAEEELARTGRAAKKGKGGVSTIDAWNGTVYKHWDSRVFGNLINVGGNNAIQRGGAVTVNIGKSIEEISDKLMNMQITASVAHKSKGKKESEAEDESENDSLTGKMGFVHLVSHGVYKVNVASSVANMVRNEVGELDMELLEDTIKHLFIADASLSRPVGSLRVAKCFKFVYPSSLSVVNPNLTHAEMVDGELVVTVDDETVNRRKIQVSEIDCETDE